MTGDDHTTSQKLIRGRHGGMTELPAFIKGLIVRLQLEDGLDYDVGVVRVSKKGNFQALEDQQDTGVNVFDDNADFQALAGMEDVRERGWLPVTYGDVGGTRLRRTVFAWVGVVGRTIFIAAADTVAQANLPPDKDDIQGVGRNGYVELIIACARAGNARNVRLPFLSRMWRNDLWPEMLMASINRHLPGCTVWNGRRKLATYGSEKLVTNVEGRQAASYVEVFKEQVFEKGVRHISAGGQWDRRESELPLGLERERVVQSDGTVKKSLVVIESEWREVAGEALKKRAAGESYQAIGRFLAAKRVPMPGTLARGRTFADYSSNNARTTGTKTIFSGRRLDYYRTGEWDELRTVDLPNEEIRGIKLGFDPETGRRTTTVRVTMPWRPFLTDSEWAAFDAVEAADADRRVSGAAAHDRSRSDLVSPFQGVSRYVDADDGLEHVLVPDSPTAYRWRTREPLNRGWHNDEGTITATLRRTLFHARFGAAFLDALRGIEQLAPAASRQADDEPLAEAQREIARLEGDIALQTSIIADADEERRLAKLAGDADEVTRQRKRCSTARHARNSLEGALAAARDQLSATADEIIETVETHDADIAEAVLVASLLLDGDKTYEPIVLETLRDYGVLETLRLTRTGPQMVRATATARVPLLDGTRHAVTMTWETPDSHDMTGDAALVPAMVRLWAAGHGEDEIAVRFPGHDADRVRRRLREALKRGGVATRALRTAAIKCPVLATRAVIAAVVLDDAQLAAPFASDYRAQVEAAYFGDTPSSTSTWADTATLREVRRVLDVLAVDHDGLGANADLLARNAGVTQALVRSFARDGLLEKVGPLALRAKRCTCGGLLTIYLPAPETGSGLICGHCWRAEGLAAALPGDYAEPWVRTTAGDHAIDVHQAVTPAKPQRDRLLTTTESAHRLGISADGVRRLDRDGELAPTTRHGSNGGRLYAAAALDAVRPETLASWQARFGPSDDDGLLATADVAALLECTPALVRDMRQAGILVPAATTPGGHARYRREDVNVIDRDGIRAYELTEIGAAAEAVGLPTHTLRDLSNDGLVPCNWTVMGSRRFDIDAIKAALQELDLLGSPTNPIVSIGELAAHPDVRLPTALLRRLTDDGIIRSAGRLGGKRRYRLQDALEDLRSARRAGTAPTADSA